MPGAVAATYGHGRVFFRTYVTKLSENSGCSVCSLSPMLFNPFPVFPENTGGRRQRLQHLPQDNSQVTVLTFSPKLATHYLPLIIIMFRITLVYRWSLETTDIVLFIAFGF